jgi:hypothetical protein
MGHFTGRVRASVFLCGKQARTSSSGERQLVPLWVRDQDRGAADRGGGTFWVVGLGARRLLAGTTSRSPSITYVPSPTLGRNLDSLELHYFDITSPSCSYI